jgi:uncharacterized membrane protein
MGPFARYALPLLSLGAVTAGLLLTRRHRPLGKRAGYVLAGVAALPLVGSGTLHLLRPAAFVPLLPPWVPDRVALIVATGVPELVGAVGLFFAVTRRPAATWLAVFMIVIFPANIYVAGERVQGLQMPGVPVRLAMQAGYIFLLLLVGYGWPLYGRRSAGPAPAVTPDAC